MSDASGSDTWREQNRRFFASREKTLIWLREVPQVPLEESQYPELYARVRSMCQVAGIAPIQLAHCVMKTPSIWSISPTEFAHVACSAPDKIVVSDEALRLLNARELSTYIAHKLIHQFHGVSHIASKVAPSLVAISTLLTGFIAGARGRDVFPPVAQEKMTRRKLMVEGSIKGVLAGSLLGMPTGLVTDYWRERHADRLAVSLTQDPPALLSMLTTLQTWCKHHGIDAEIAYPGIGFRIKQAKDMVKGQGNNTLQK